MRDGGFSLVTGIERWTFRVFLGVFGFVILSFLGYRFGTFVHP